VREREFVADARPSKKKASAPDEFLIDAQVDLLPGSCISDGLQLLDSRNRAKGCSLYMEYDHFLQQNINTHILLVFFGVR